MQNPFLRFLGRLRAALVYAALLLPAYAWGGNIVVAKAPLRILSLALFVSYGVEIVFRRQDRAARAAARLGTAAVFLSAFLPYFGYVVLQWKRGHALFRGIHLGTAVCHPTLDNTVQLLCYGLLLLAFYAHFRTRRRVRLALLLLAFEIAILMAVGFYHEHGDIHRAQSVLGIGMEKVVHYYSFFVNGNYYGAYLAIVMPLLAASLFDYGRKFSRQDFRLDLPAVEKIFFLALFPIVIVSMLDADSRGALFWLFLSLLTMAVILLIRRRGFLLAVVPLAAALVFVVLGNPRLTPAKLLSDLGDRMVFAQASTEILKDFPYFGSGLGTFYYIFPSYNTMRPENFSPDQPYNHHLQLLIETGVGGYAMFLLPFGVLAAICLPAILKSKSRWEATFGLTAFVVMGTTALVSLIDNYLSTPAIAIIFVFYLAIAMRSAEGAFYYDVTEPLPGPRRLDPFRAVVFVAVAALLVPMARYVMNDALSDRYSTAPSKSERNLLRATAATPDHVFSWFELGDFYYQQSLHKSESKEDGRPDARKAVEAFRKVSELAPVWPKGWDYLGQAEVLAGDRLKGLSHLGFAIQLQPLNRDRYVYLITLALKLSKTSPWKEERRIASQLAYGWIAKAAELPRPLTPTDFKYIGVFGTSPESAVDNAYLQVALQKYYLSRKDRNAPSPYELAS
ncbi:MAG TPA: O-antigen ligase family protein [Candidatus Eisenbacteria bacterium]|nr:O-antigen ligase family protein [Candidatus Eisenbacteria bacterium]